MPEQPNTNDAFIKQLKNGPCSSDIPTEGGHVLPRVFFDHKGTGQDVTPFLCAFCAFCDLPPFL